MIKINLLAVDRERTKRKGGGGAKFQISAQNTTLVSSLLLVATALLIGWWFWALRSESAELDQQIAEAQREKERLRSVIQQVEQFEARRAQLQQRVTLIEQLRKGQTGPVHLLDVISRSLPESMWLTEMRQNATDVQLEGRCTSLTSLSDFVGALETSGQFERPVEIIDSQAEPGTPTTPELIRFSVKARPSVAK